MAILVKLSKTAFTLSLAALIGCSSSAYRPPTDVTPMPPSSGNFDHQVALCSVQDAFFLRRVVNARKAMGLNTTVEEAGEYVLKVANSCATDPVGTRKRLTAIDEKMIAAGLLPQGPSEQELEDQTKAIEARLRLMEEKGQLPCLKE